MKRLIIFLCLLPALTRAQKASNTIPQTKPITDTSVQTDLVDVAKNVFNINPKKIQQKRDRKIDFSLLPFGNAPGGTGRALITSTTAGVYLGPRRTTNKSNATFAPYWNFKGRFGLPLRSSIWLPNNTWNIQGDIRFLVYPQNTWGTGSSTNNDRKIMVDYTYIRMYQAALKQIRPHFYAGFGYNLDHRFNIRTSDSVYNLKSFTGYDFGTNSSSLSSGFTFQAFYDTRHNLINPLPGFYANFIYRVNPKMLGNKEPWHSVYVDVRKYISLNRRRPSQQNTLAFWSYFWKVLNDGAPYLDLPSTGWDPYNRSARGIDQNRYRGKTLLYFEGEYRRDITRNGLFGFAVFANTNTVSGNNSFLRDWHPAVGAGLRIKSSKVSGTNIAIDYGFSKGFRAIMVNISEAF
ncbi:hypothetical protein LZZ85_14520 [Terrimonas sp. NA20]|uniref:Bacterial surface antigen (D15) domain-containing protein n=1 Tax=Terrimonas ginsenosidimutans TaxID=2908004 RepID=A0ABS9KT48_9BACT|nr:hypothetical protein [Terrimonas ginsenosidimutans]MCG2615511.1 hypothetical protein [Terrimonas ginsenosidimutans]